MELTNERDGDVRDRNMAQKNSFKFPSDMFGTYKSTEINTLQPTFPMRKIAILIFGCLMVRMLL